VASRAQARVGKLEQSAGHALAARLYGLPLAEFEACVNATNPALVAALAQAYADGAPGFGEVLRALPRAILDAIKAGDPAGIEAANDAYRKRWG
jgi:hypothetical protein